MSLSCSRVQPLVAGALLGDLDEATRAEIQGHAQACAECGSALRFQSALQAEIEASPLASPPSLYFEGVLAEIHRRGTLRAQRAPIRRRRMTREHTATAMVGALALIWFVTSFGPLLPKHSWRVFGGKPSGVPVVADSQIAAASFRKAGTLVIVEGVGLIDSRSQLLVMPAALLRDLGISIRGPIRRLS